MIAITRFTHVLRVFFIAALLMACNAAFAYAAEVDLDANTSEPAQASQPAQDSEPKQSGEEPSAPAQEPPAPATNNANTSEAPAPAANEGNADTTGIDNVTVTEPENTDGATENEQTPGGTNEETPVETVDQDAVATEETASEADSDATTAEPTSETGADATTAEEPVLETQDATATETATTATAVSTGTSVAATTSVAKSTAKKAAKRTISAKKYKKLLKVLYKGLKKHASRINVAKLKLRKADLRTLNQAFWDVVYEKHPEIFWARGDFYYWWNGANKIYKIKPYYLYSKKKTKTLKRKYEKAMKQLMSWVPKKASTAQKAKAVHDWLIRKCSYNHTAVKYKSSWLRKNSKNYPWTSLGAMVYKEPVCQGYTLAFQDAMNRLKIKSIAVENGSHSWNRVKVGKKWYTVDVTNDDDGGASDVPSTSVFLKSSAYCKQHYSNWASYAKWRMLGGYAPSGSKSSGTAYDKTSTLSWKIYGPRIDLVWADWNVTDDAYVIGRTTYKPSIKVTIENDYTTFTLVEGRDYTVSYRYDMYSGSATITGKGNFTGTRTAYFNINRY